ncbi:spore germination protein GerPB [Peribacillus sp. SCS-37]|uniref:spore germination protein GerPB n=1 Tax=Paraperibacillus esterisolvens TaxID=3115296 RepID=UPI0039063008
MALTYNIQQSIHINMIRIDGMSQSSVFQIGSTGVMKSLATQSNTGGFTAAAPEAVPLVPAAPSR